MNRSMRIKRKISISGKLIAVQTVEYIRDFALQKLGLYDTSDIQKDGLFVPSKLDFETLESVALCLGGSAYTRDATESEQQEHLERLNGIFGLSEDEVPNPLGKDAVIALYDITVTEVTKTGFIVEAYGKRIEISIKEI